MEEAYSDQFIDRPGSIQRDRSPIETILGRVRRDYGNRGFEKFLDLHDVEVELEEKPGELENINNSNDYRNLIFKEVEDWNGYQGVVKVFPKTRHNMRKDFEMEFWDRVNNPALNSIKSAEENPGFFPPAYKIGHGKLRAGNYNFEIEIIKQEYIDDYKTLKEGLDEYAFDDNVKDMTDVALDRWMEFIERNLTVIDGEFGKEILKTKQGEKGELKKFIRKHSERFPGLVAENPVNNLKNDIDFLKDYDLPEARMKKSKIVGDFAPRQILWGTEDESKKYITFDTEKYGEGEVARDLSKMIEELIKKFDPELAEEVLTYIDRKMDNKDLAPRLERSIVGFRAERLYNSPFEDTYMDVDDHKELLEKNIEFYKDLEL